MVSVSAAIAESIYRSLKQGQAGLTTLSRWCSNAASLRNSFSPAVLHQNLNSRLLESIFSGSFSAQSTKKPLRWRSRGNPLPHFFLALFVCASNRASATSLPRSRSHLMTLPSLIDTLTKLLWLPKRVPVHVKARIRISPPHQPRADAHHWVEASARCYYCSEGQ